MAAMVERLFDVLSLGEASFRPVLPLAAVELRWPLRNRSLHYVSTGDLHRQTRRQEVCSLWLAGASLGWRCLEVVALQVYLPTRPGLWLSACSASRMETINTITFPQ